MGWSSFMLFKFRRCPLRVLGMGVSQSCGPLKGFFYAHSSCKNWNLIQTTSATKITIKHRQNSAFNTEMTGLYFSGSKSTSALKNCSFFMQWLKQAWLEVCLFSTGGVPAFWRGYIKCVQRPCEGLLIVDGEVYAHSYPLSHTRVREDSRS